MCIVPLLVGAKMHIGHDSSPSCLFKPGTFLALYAQAKILSKPTGLAIVSRQIVHCSTTGWSQNAYGTWLVPFKHCLHGPRFCLNQEN